MELIFILLFFGFIYKKIKKAAGIQKKFSELDTEDFQKLKEQGSTDLQKLLNNLDSYAAKKNDSHVHSDSNYNNKNYVTKTTQDINASGEPTVQRGAFDRRTSDQTISRKNYD